MKISKRLQCIAWQVPSGAVVADIGSDHALLPIYLVQSGNTPSAIAGEINAGPYAAALSGVETAGLSDKIEVRRGNGLAVIEPLEASCVTIAGMGGSLMTDILSDGLTSGKLQGVQTLVLQPNVGEDVVRRWLIQHGWYLCQEQIIEEDGKIYEIITAIRASDEESLNRALYDPAFLQASGEPEEKRELLLKMGPWLLRRPSEVLIRKWNSEINKLEKICNQMEASDIEASKHKLQMMREDSRKIQEVLTCLPMDK